MKNIEDYLHFYFKGWGTITNSKHKVYSGGEWALSATILHAAMMNELVFTPHLRTLSNMTEDEMKTFADFIGEYGDMPGRRTYEIYKNGYGQFVISWGTTIREKYSIENSTHYKPEALKYLLSIGIDMFELIKDGLAIDATKLKTGSIA
jgi:hypothetical protein